MKRMKININKFTKIFLNFISFIFTLRICLSLILRRFYIQVISTFITTNNFELQMDTSFDPEEQVIVVSSICVGTEGGGGLFANLDITITIPPPLFFICLSIKISDNSSPPPPFQLLICNVRYHMYNLVLSHTVIQYE